MVEKINELILLDSGDINAWYKENKKAAADIIRSLDWLDLERNRHGRVCFRQAVWHYKNASMFKPRCLNNGCQNYVKWNDTTHMYQQFCSNSCSHNHGEAAKKRQLTVLQTYGVDNVFRDVERMKACRRAKLGVDHATQSSEIKERTKSQHMQKYGVDHPWKRSDIRRKCVVSRQDDIFIPHDKKMLLESHDWMTDNLVTQAKTQQQVADELHVSQSTVGVYAKKLNIEFAPRSKIQIQVQQFLSTHLEGAQVVSNARNILADKTELDIFIPHLNLAIEVNGVYWHGELNGRDNKYHITKLQQASARNIKLIQLYDTEWHSRSNIVKSRLAAAVGGNRKIYARKTNIVELSVQQSRQFFADNHIQGFVGAHVSIGLCLDGEVVAAMSLGKSRYDATYQYELLRYCSKNYTNVIGGASKLFKHFITTYRPTNVVSYCDLRWGTGNMYEQLKFECVARYTNPNYAYFKRNEVGTTHELYSRIMFQKHKLKEKLPIFDPNVSEWENLKLNGYDRIWDCGNSKWAWYS